MQQLTKRVLELEEISSEQADKIFELQEAVDSLIAALQQRTAKRLRENPLNESCKSIRTEFGLDEEQWTYARV